MVTEYKRKRLEGAVAQLNALKATAAIEPGLPAFQQYLTKLQDVHPVQKLNGETFDTLDGKSDWRPERRGHMPYLAIPRALAHSLWGWGTVTEDGKAVKAAGPAFDFSQAFIALCEARKTRKGDAWTNDEKATLQAEVKRFPNRAKGLREAIAQALGLGSAEAVSQILREYKQAQDDARKAAANVVQVRDGKKVG